MKLWTRLIALSLSVMVSASAQAITLEELQQRFAEQAVVRADFNQQRHIKGMSQPLRSNGQLLVSSEQGLWWQQQAPFPLTLVLDDHRMVEVINDQRPQIITADSNPQMFQFNHILRALFQADRQLLEQNFLLNFTDQGQGRWQLLLHPTTSPLDKLFKEIRLQGQQYLEHITLDDRQGDSTEITFSNQQLTPSTLTADELQRFVF